MPAFETYRPGAHGVPDRRCSIRRARPGDVPGVLVVASSRGPQPADLGDRLARWIADPGRLVLVAHAPSDDPVPSARTVVGWTMLARWQGGADAREGWLVGALTVAPGRRRAGIGARLLAGLLDRPPGRGAAVHSVVNATNRASIALHEGLGFHEVDRGPSFAGITFTGGIGVLLRVGPDRAAAGPAAGERTVGDHGTDRDEIEHEEPV
ncbi:MAG TPA: GNAT family N-acetyltransferase [Cellulomonas sp.]